MDEGSYNDNRPPEQPIQMVFDFTYDLAELALPASREGPKRQILCSIGGSTRPRYHAAGRSVLLNRAHFAT